MSVDLPETLARYRQQHLLEHAAGLDEARRQALQQQISALDLQQIHDLFLTRDAEHQWAELARRAAPPEAIRLGDSDHVGTSRADAVERGVAALAAGEIGLVMVAGGQGSRLGFNHPKGMYPLGPVSGRTLFQIHFDKLAAVGHRYGVTIPLYIMTSPATHEETVTWLKQHDWFGYPADYRRTFCQGTMPAVDAENGQILLSAAGELFLGPDGHGGMLAAIERSGALEDIDARGLRQLFYCQVDNPLCQICDPLTIGYHLASESEMSSQAIPKTGPLQSVGNLVSIDGRIHVIEYSDLPGEVACQTRADGSLLLWAGSIAVHVFDVDFLKRMAQHAGALPFHLARKKVPYLDRSGQRVEPASPNALKFEKFIFDLLPLARHSIVVEVDPAEAFSPVKNSATGSTSTVLTAQQAILRQARTALQQIDVDVDSSIPVELAPELLANPDALRQRLAGLSDIREPVYLK